MPIYRECMQIEPGTDLFHCSRQLDGLMAVGQFDAKHSEHSGAMYFTVRQAKLSNCIATVSRRLYLIELQTHGNYSGLDLFTEVHPGMYASDELDGYDGKVYPKVDPYTEVQSGIYSEEVVIFSGALAALTNIRSV